MRNYTLFFPLFLLPALVVLAAFCGWFWSNPALGLGVFAAALGAGGLLAVARRAEERSLQDKARTECLINNIPDGIIMANLRGEVLYINHAATRILGDFPGGDRAPRELSGLLRQEQLRECVQKILKRHAHSEIIELPVRDGEGGIPRYFRTTVTLFSMPGLENYGVLLMMRDVTIERELAVVKEEFLHSVAHDLRAPVFAAQGYVRLLEKSVPQTDKTREYFGAIYQACEKLLFFIRDILDVQRLEAGRLKLDIARFEPLGFLERMRAVYGPVAREKGIELEVLRGESTPNSLAGDARLLERVLHNLISNALKYTPPGGSIRMAVAAAPEDQIEFFVEDTGPGIAPEGRAVIFEKFQQGPDDPARSGYGLGLYICQKIVELHRGRIWVESNVGRGSKFTFRLPRVQPG